MSPSRLIRWATVGRNTSISSKAGIDEESAANVGEGSPSARVLAAFGGWLAITVLEAGDDGLKQTLLGGAMSMWAEGLRDARLSQYAEGCILRTHQNRAEAA
jgi:hypothetical protein